MRRRGLGRTVARTAVVAGTATAVSGKVASKQRAKAEQNAAGQAPPPPAEAEQAEAASDGLTDETVEQLKKLGELRDAGILTDEEFTAKKAKLLGI